MSDAPPHARSGSLWLPVALLIVALGLRLSGTLYGLPYGYHPDEEHVLEPAREIVASGDLDPGWYRYPDVTIYLQATVQAITSGVSDAPVTFPHVREQDWVSRWLGRLVTAILGLLALVLTWRATVRLAGERAGLFALAPGATALLHVQHSHFITTDVPASLFAAATLWACARALEDRRWLWGAAAFAGMAAATKYNAGVVVIAPVALGIALAPRRALQTIAGCGFASLAAFIALMPWVVLQPAAWWADLTFELHHYREGQVGFSSGFGPWVLGRYLVLRGTGLLGAAVAIIGAVSLVRSDRQRAAAVLAFPLLYFTLLSSMTVHADRNLVPMLPFLWALIGIGAERVYGWSAAAWAARHDDAPAVWLAPVLVTLLALPLGVRSARYTVELVAEDTRTEAFDWVLEHVPPQVRVCTEYYGPTLPATHRVFELPSVCLRGEALLRTGCDVVITSSFMEAMFAEDPEEHADTLGCYGDVRRDWRRLVTFSGTPIDIYNDPEIRIFQNPGLTRPSGASGGDGGSSGGPAGNP